jgi:hypothetical protein
LAAETVQAARQSGTWPDVWWLPLLWLVLEPLVTVPMQVERLGSSGGFASARPYERCELVRQPADTIVPGMDTPNSWRCDPEDVVMTLFPGVLNFVPALFVLWPRSRTRRAALLGTALGASRVAAPAIIYLVLGTVTFSTHYFPGPTESVIASIGLWILTVVAFFWFPSDDAEKRGREAEATP